MVLALSYLLTLVLFLAADAVWLGSMGARFYKFILGDILAEPFRIAPAVAFYLLYAAGLCWAGTWPGLKEGWMAALTGGALFGLFCYGTYNLTNLATLNRWTVTLAGIDMAWGVVASAVAAALAARIIAHFA